MTATRRKIAEALTAAGFPGVTIEKGKGYWYFVGGDTALWRSTGVYVYRLTAFSVEQWVEEARWLADQEVATCR